MTTANVRSISPSISFTSENMNRVRYATNTEKTMTKTSKSNIVQEGRTLDEKILFQNEVSFISQRYGNGRGKSSGGILRGAVRGGARGGLRGRGRGFSASRPQFWPILRMNPPFWPSRPQFWLFLRMNSPFGPTRPHICPFLRTNRPLSFRAEAKPESRNLFTRSSTRTPPSAF